MLRFACSILAATMAAVFLAAGVAAPSALADSSCADLKVCFWSQADFDGDKRSYDADDAGSMKELNSHDRSIKNKFGSRRVQIMNAQGTIIDCVDAGINENNMLAASDYFKIGATNTSCPG